MKRILICGLALFVVTASVHAQSDTAKAPHQQQHKSKHHGVYSQLGLTADQQAKVKSLNDDFKKQRDALKTQKLTEDERNAGMKALRNQHQTAVEALLTPVQKEQLAKIKSERQESMGKRKSFRNQAYRANGDSAWKSRDGKGGVTLQKELNLTTEQQVKMKEIRTGFKTKAETVRNDAALTSEQKREQLRSLMQAQQEQMKSVLTKEQQEKMQSLRKERAARHTK